jgi:mono/diheme cytochrome c family protein
MRKRRIDMKRTLLFLGAFFFLAAITNAQDGKALFNRNCTSCHTIGGGRKVGPDLKGVTQKRKPDWIVKFVQSSKDVIASGDADAVALFNEFNKIPMPSHNLSSAEVLAIINFIASGGDAGGTAAKGKDNNLNPVFKPSADVGRSLFTGSKRLTNGGPSCISCHSIRDAEIYLPGTFAKDLSISYVEGVVEAMLNSMPAMISTYQLHPLTLEEKTHLEFYLKTVKENQVYSHVAQYDNTLILLGVLKFFIIILILNLFWKHEKNEGVKEEIYKRQVKTQ